VILVVGVGVFVVGMVEEMEEKEVVVLVVKMEVEKVEYGWPIGESKRLFGCWFSFSGNKGEEEVIMKEREECGVVL